MQRPSHNGNGEYDDNNEERARSHMDNKTKQVVGLLAINGQSYDAPVTVSNSTQRQINSYVFSPQSYSQISSSTVANIVFNTGASMVNASTSSVILTVNFNGTTDRTPQGGNKKYLCWSFGDNLSGQTIGKNTLKSGSSATNLFNQISLKSRGGQFPAQVVDSNVLSCALAPFQKGQGAENLFGESGGASMTHYVGNATDQPLYQFPMFYCSRNATFEIPLSKLMAGSVFGQQAPLLGQFISGATLSLRFENMLRAMVFYETEIPPNDYGKPPILGEGNLAIADVVANYPTVSYNVTDMQLMADCMTITDSCLSAINSKCKSLQSSGCQYPYYGVYQTKTTLTSSSADINILISAASIQTIIVSFLRPANLATGKYDALARLPIINAEDGAVGRSCFAGAKQTGKLGGDNSSVRLRIGSEYQSLIPYTSAGQLFRQTYQSLCSVKDGLLNDTDYLHKLNKPVDIAVDFNSWYYGSGASSFAFDLSKTPIVGNAGSVSNNSRSVILELRGINAGAVGIGEADASIECYIHAFYLNVANISMENVIVDM